MPDRTSLSTQFALQKRESLREKARLFVRHSKSTKTLRAYDTTWRDFLAFCQTHQLQPLPALPEKVSLYLAYIADYAKVATLQPRLVAISQAYQAAGYLSPTGDLEVRATIGGIRRAKGIAPAPNAPPRLTSSNKCCKPSRWKPCKVYATGHSF